MINLLYIDLFCGAGGTSTGIGNAVEVTIARKLCEALCSELRKFDFTDYLKNQVA